MTHNFGGRIERLETMVRVVGCATCRRWDHTVIKDEQGAVSRPETCPACGRRVPYRLVVELHGVDLDSV